MRLPPFQTLIDDHGTALLRYLRAAVGAQDAEDAWQETMLAALRAYPDLRTAQNLRGWLFTIAHRKALDAHRSGTRRPVPTDAAPDPAVHDAESDPVLWAAVRRLPQKQRAAVTLRFAGDLDYRDIAALIDCTEGAARQNVRAGLAAVRKDWVHERVTN